MPPPDSTKHAARVNDHVYDVRRKDIPGLQPNGFIKALGKDEDRQLLVIVKYFDDKFTMKNSIVEYNYNEEFKGCWAGRGYKIGFDWDVDQAQLRMQFEEAEAEIDRLCGMKPLNV